MIKFNNVSMTYNERTTALKDVSFNIEPGEFVFLVGSSGAGKSTVINLLLREKIATTGNVVVDGKILNKIKKRKIPEYRRTLGVVFQDFKLLENRTVYENVAFAMEVVQASVKSIRRQVPNVLGMVGLQGKANDYPQYLSGGEQQRVAVARALVNHPAIFIADEPTGNLDPNISQEIMELIKMINHQGTTVIVATHDKEIVNKMKKRVIELKDGKIIRDELRGRYHGF